MQLIELCQLSLNDILECRVKAYLLRKNIGLVRNTIEADHHVNVKSIQATLKVGMIKLRSSYGE